MVAGRMAPWVVTAFGAVLLTGMPSDVLGICSPVSTFKENTAPLCATVLVVRVIEAGKTLPGASVTGADVVVEHTLKGRAPAKRLTLWHVLQGAPATPEHCPSGSRWVVVLRHYRDENPDYDEDRDAPIGYLLGGLSPCTGPLVAPLDSGDTSVKSLKQRFQKEAREIIPRREMECAAGESLACYELACAHEQGLGTRRSTQKAAELYRRAFELEVRDR